MLSAGFHFETLKRDLLEGRERLAFSHSQFHWSNLGPVSKLLASEQRGLT